MGPQGFNKAELSKENFIELLDAISFLFPSMPTFEVLRLYFSQPKEVCPTAFIDEEALYMLETEQSCREYHVLPFEGGMWNQPKKLIHYFTHIRTVRNEYERQRMEQIKKESKSSNRKDNKIPDSLKTGDLSLPPRKGNLSQ